MTADQVIANFETLQKRGEQIVWSPDTIKILIDRIHELEDQWENHYAPDDWDN